MSAEDLEALALLGKHIENIGEADTGRFPIFFVGGLAYKVIGVTRRGELVALSLCYDGDYEEFDTDVLVDVNVVANLLVQLTIGRV